MTEDEIRENMNQLVYVKAEGTREDKQQIRIIDFDPNMRSPWGKGVVTIEFPHEQDRGRIKHPMSQLELINGNKKVKKRKKRKTGKVS